MIPAHRQRFNREFTEPRYAAFVAAIEKSCGAHVSFRLSETPFFMPASLLARLEGVAQELIGQLLSNGDHMNAAAAMVPAPFRHAHGETRPTCIQVDFGLLKTPSGIEARLVELQAFPSLYGFQMLLSETAREDRWLHGVDAVRGGTDPPAVRRAHPAHDCRRSRPG